MAANLLVTGPPRVGKSTVLDRLVAALEAEGLDVGGVRSPEIREEGRRVGFRIVDVATGEGAVMAHRDRDRGPSVGSYRVDVDAVAQVAGPALERAREGADAAVVDEIAPMEVASDAFVEAARALLDAATPVVAAVHQRSTSGFVGEVKGREDADLVTVTGGNRDALPGELAERVLEGVP